MPRIGLTVFVVVGLAWVTVGCARERQTIDPVPPAPLASGYETRSTDLYGNDAPLTPEFSPVSPEAPEAPEAPAPPVPPVSQEPVVVAEPPVVVEAVEPVRPPAPAPTKDGAPLVPVKDSVPVRDGGPATASGGGNVHVVAEKDTLWDLAQKYYGTGLDWEKIANANPGINPKKLKVGQKLIIP